jgi:biopolymer transport protein ExbD
MDFNRLSSLVAVPLASLFLIVVLCVFGVQRPPSVGVMVPLEHVRVVPNKECDFLSDREIVVQLHRDGSTWINETRVSHDKLRSELAEIFKYRHESYVYITSDPDVSFEEFANLYSTVDSSTSNIRIVLLTAKMRALIQQCPPGGVCELIWHDFGDIFCGISPSFRPFTFRAKDGTDPAELN